jgi:hypothetical protein
MAREELAAQEAAAAAAARRAGSARGSPYGPSASSPVGHSRTYDNGGQRGSPYGAYSSPYGYGGSRPQSGKDGNGNGAPSRALLV